MYQEKEICQIFLDGIENNTCLNLLIYEQILQDKFKVKNPYLLKTGTLATLINILAIKKLLKKA